jgi:hypothetical protein
LSSALSNIAVKQLELLDDFWLFRAALPANSGLLWANVRLRAVTGLIANCLKITKARPIVTMKDESNETLIGNPNDKSSTT